MASAKHRKNVLDWKKIYLPIYLQLLWKQIHLHNELGEPPEVALRKQSWDTQIATTSRRHRMFFQDTEKYRNHTFWCGIVCTPFFYTSLHLLSTFFTKYKTIAKIPKASQILRQEKSSTPSEIHDIFSQVSHVSLTLKLWSWSILLLFFLKKYHYQTTFQVDGICGSVFANRNRIFCGIIATTPHLKKWGISGVSSAMSTLCAPSVAKRSTATTEAT